MDRTFLSRPFLLRSLCAGAVLAALIVLPGCMSNLEKFRREGVAEYKKADYDQSLESLNKALSYDQFDPVANAYAGLIHYRAKEYVQAEYHFRVALQADPSSEEAKAGLVATLVAKGEPDKALDALERAAELSEKVDDPRWRKSNIKVVYDKGVEERLFVGKVNDRIRIARAYEKLGDYDNALVYYKKALEMAPEDASVLLAMGELAEKAGNKPEAREYLRRAYIRDPALPGLTDAMTRNGLAISEVISAKGTPIKAPAPAPAPAGEH